MYVFILHEQGEDQDMNLVGSVGHLGGGHLVQMRREGEEWGREE